MQIGQIIDRKGFIREIDLSKRYVFDWFHLAHSTNVLPEDIRISGHPVVVTGIPGHQIKIFLVFGPIR